MPPLRSVPAASGRRAGRLALVALIALSLLPAAGAAAHRGVRPQIVGGQPVPQGTYPFMAHIEIDLGDFVILCGGSLIAPQFVLTAAHCVEDADTGTRFRPDQFSVVIGVADLLLASPENEFGVRAVAQDPNWDRDAIQNDAAVLTLDRAVPTDVAQPVSFVASGDEQFDGAGQPAVVAGWGTTREGGQTTPDQLLAAQLAIVDAADCQAAYGDELQPALELCAAASGRDTCQGDSGGPLLAPQGAQTAARRTKGRAGRRGVRPTRKHHHHHPPPPPPPPPPPSRVTQIGITSFGIGCARPGIPGVYTRLSNPAVNAFVAGVLAGE